MSSSIYPRSVTGLIVAPGTPYRQRQITVRFYGDDHAVPVVMSVLDIPERDAFVELHRAHSPTTLVARHLRVFEMFWHRDDGHYWSRHATKDEAVRFARATGGRWVAPFVLDMDAAEWVPGGAS